jgi:hypothetical protein
LHAYLLLSGSSHSINRDKTSIGRKELHQRDLLAWRSKRSHQNFNQVDIGVAPHWKRLGGYGKTSLLASVRGEKLWGNLVAWQHNVVQSIVFTMKVPDRPGDISILTRTYVSDNRTVTLNILFILIWAWLSLERNQNYLIVA